MLNNKIQLKNKMHILLIVSFISVAIISFFFTAKQSFAAGATDWTIPGYNGDYQSNPGVNSDEPKNEFRIGIDDIVYNRVPLFDINVFSDKPGGKDIDTTSPLYFLRQIVATWFVMGMELALVAMVIIIIYTGIRMALTTIAEKKAEYKEMLFSFVKAIAKIFVLAAIMALIINICQYLTSLFAEHGPDPTEPISGKNLYVTMVTRALGSFSFKAKLPAAILFFGLTLTFFKFSYRYLKRLLNVYLLIIVAPVLVAKDAFEGASGKQGKTFSAWLQEFTLNVALQPAHALIYTSLVYVALNNATNNVLNFLVAVLIMNFMISADKIFFKIFNMRFTKGPGAAGATDALTEGVKMYAGIQAAKEGAKLYGKTVAGTAKFAKNTGRVVGGTVSNISNKLASMDNPTGERIREKQEERKKRKEQKEKDKRAEGEKPNGFLETLDSIKGGINKGKKTINKGIAQGEIRSAEAIENGQGIAGKMPRILKDYINDAKLDRATNALGKARNKKNEDKNFISQMAELRSLAKRNDETGRITRKLLKMKREHELKKFKYIGSAIGGVVLQGASILTAPGLIMADETDMALAGLTATMGNTSTAIVKHYHYRRNAKDELLTQRSFEDTLESLKNVNGDLGTLQAKFDAIELGNAQARKDTYEQMAAYSELKLDEHTIRTMLNSYLTKNGIKAFDESALDDMLDKVLSESGATALGIDSEKIEQIRSSLKAEMLNAQTNRADRVNSRFADALNAGSEESENKFTVGEVVDIAMDSVKGEDLSELTDRQILKLIDDAVAHAKTDDPRMARLTAESEILKLANEQREAKFTEEMKKVTNAAATEGDFEKVEAKIEKRAEGLVRMLAVEKLEDKEKYVDIITSQLETSNLTDEQKAEIREKVEEKVTEAINTNYAEREKDRMDKQASAAAFASLEGKLVENELDNLNDSHVLSKEVREAIDNIKRDVKHEKTKRGSIGTIADLDKRLKHMRDVL